MVANFTARLMLAGFTALSCLALLGGCSYLGGAMEQARLAALHRQAPAQRVYKHMLEVENFFVFGKVKNGGDLNEEAAAVVAVSSLHDKSEVVDVCQFSRISSIFGLNLPAGDYQLLVVSDRDGDGFYSDFEVAGGRRLSLDPAASPDKVVGDFDIDLDIPYAPSSPVSFRLERRKTTVLSESLVYPRGSIRSLDDEIFSRRMATLGMYQPAAFLEEAPMMFYALEENLGYKVPVVFVHGIDGSARDFSDLVATLDRRRYCPWFFHYPSGEDLGQLSEMFYSIFLSGKTIPLGEMPLVIVAHSMGGLVVRDALNRMSGDKGENRVARLVTIASPLGGHPAAAMSSQGPLVLPSWRDVNPESDFLRGLWRKKLPDGLEYDLIYAYGNERVVKLGENSDGVVPLSSQLCSRAQDESTAQYGYNDTHSGILRNPEAIKRLVGLIETVKAPFPDEHMAEFLKGGYEVNLGEEYDPWGKHAIRNFGRWLEALAAGRIAPVDPYHDHFVQVCRGEASPDTPIEKAWLRFTREYPERDGLERGVCLGGASPCP